MKTVVLALIAAAEVFAGPGGNEDFEEDLSGLVNAVPLPPYLKNVTEDARKEYFGTVLSMNKTVAQLKQNVLEWAQKHGVEAEAQEFNANLTSNMRELKQNVTELINSLPSTLQQFASLIENENQTPAQLKNATEALAVQNLKAFKILMFALGDQLPRNGRPRFEGFDRFGNMIFNNNLTSIVKETFGKINANLTNTVRGLHQNVTDLIRSLPPGNNTGSLNGWLNNLEQPGTTSDDTIRKKFQGVLDGIGLGSFGGYNATDLVSKVNQPFK